MNAERLIEKINVVLDSDLTAYRIAKDVGYAGANPVHDLRSGKSDIFGVKLSTAMEFEKLYDQIKEEEKRMEKIKGIINEVLEGKRELDTDFDPDFYEQPFTGGADEIYIGHFVEGFEGDEAIMLYFPEKAHIIEARNQNWMGDLSDEELDALLENVNDYEDRFDYNKVAAYTDDLGLNWL